MNPKTAAKKDIDSPALIYAAFGFGFRFLSQVYLDIPTEDFLRKVHKNKLFFEWPVAENFKTVSRGLKILQDFITRWQPDRLNALKLDYTRLFIGLEKVLAPPYASVYLSEDFLLYEKPLLEVRRFYEKLGLHVHPKKRDPDDHIGFELYGLSFLCEKTAEAINIKDKESFNRYRVLLIEFLSNHIDPWIGGFLSLVEEKAETDYFRGVAIVSSGLVESLTAFLGIDRVQD